MITQHQTGPLRRHDFYDGAMRSAHLGPLGIVLTRSRYFGMSATIFIFGLSIRITR